MLHSLIKISLRLIAWRPDLNLIMTLMASLCLLYKVEDLWGHRTLINWEETSIVSQAHAAATPAQPPAITDPSKPAEPEKKDDKFDPLMLDENQVKILQAMSKKEGDTTIADDRANIVKQEELVKVAKEKIEKQIDHLEAIQKDIKSTTNELTKQEKENVDRMVKIYESMKPLQAADILNKLEITALSQILKAMIPKKAALIMAGMDQTKVRYVTLIMLKDEKAQLALKAKEEAEQKAKENKNPENAAKT